MTRTTTMKPDRNWLLDQVAQMAGEEGPVDPAEDLTLYGIDSIAVMRLVLALEEGGVIVSFDDLAQTPTINGWWALIETRLKMG